MVDGRCFAKCTPLIFSAGLSWYVLIVSVTWPYWVPLCHLLVPLNCLVVFILARPPAERQSS